MLRRERPAFLLRVVPRCTFVGIFMLLKATGCRGEDSAHDASSSDGRAAGGSEMNPKVGGADFGGGGSGGADSGSADSGINGTGAGTNSEGASLGHPQGGEGGMGGAGPEEPHGEPPCTERRYQYFAGHGDLYVAHQGGKLSLRLRGSFEPDRARDSLYDPLDVCIRLPERAPITLPDGLAFAPTGVEPETYFWLIPQVFDPIVVWLGMATYELPVADFGVHSTLELLWDRSNAPEGGAVSLFINSTFGSPAYWLSTKEERLIFAEHLNGSHTHMNWTFNRPGQYDLVFRVTIESVEEGGTLQSEPTAVHFFVGEEE